MIGPRESRRSLPAQSAFVAVALLPLALLLPAAGRPPAGPGAPDAFLAALRAAPPPAAETARVEAAYGKLPLHFEPNHGQTTPPVQFLARGRGYSVFLTGTEAVLVLRTPAATPSWGGRPQPSTKPGRAPQAAGTVVRMQLLGATPAPQVRGRDELAGKVNYFIGNDPTKWRTNISTYAKVQYTNVYPGIDLLYYGNQRQLEYDFVVAPGADPTAIRLAFGGAEKVEIDGQGDLVLHTTKSPIRLHKPVIYQEGKGVRQEIPGGFVVHPQSEIGNPKSPVVSFHVAAYDPSKPLIIDPVLSYSTYLGGSGGDRGGAIAVDSAGNAYVTGYTTSTNFPTATPFQATHGGGYVDAFFTKLNAAGSALVYSTYLGGNGYDYGYAIAVDSAGNAYVTGYTDSVDFPTASPLQATSGGSADAFVTKLNATGSALVYSTYLGGGRRGRWLCFCGG